VLKVIRNNIHQPQYIDSAANNQVINLLKIQTLRFCLFGHRVVPLIIYPAAAVGIRGVDDFPNEALSCGILEVYEVHVRVAKGGAGGIFRLERIVILPAPFDKGGHRGFLGERIFRRSHCERTQRVRQSLRLPRRAIALLAVTKGKVCHSHESGNLFVVVIPDFVSLPRT
jgi:hypothetical protein